MAILVFLLHVTRKYWIALAVVSRDVDILRQVSTSGRLKSEAQRILLQVGRDNWKKVQVVMWEIKSEEHFLVD